MLYTLHRAQGSIILDISSRQIEIAIRIAYGLGGLGDVAIVTVRKVEEQNLAREPILWQGLTKTMFVVAWMAWDCRPSRLGGIVVVKSKQVVAGHAYVTRRVFPVTIIGLVDCITEGKLSQRRGTAGKNSEAYAYLKTGNCGHTQAEVRVGRVTKSIHRAREDCQWACLEMERFETKHFNVQNALRWEIIYFQFS